MQAITERERERERKRERERERERERRERERERGIPLCMFVNECYDMTMINVLQITLHFIKFFKFTTLRGHYSLG